MQTYTDGREKIQAVRFTGGNFQEIWDAFGWGTGIQKFTFRGRVCLRMRTAAGVVVFARPDDWVVADKLPGTFYNIEPRTFKNIWKEVT